MALVLVGLSFFVFGPREVTRRQVSSMCWATIWLPFEIIAFMLPGDMISLLFLRQSVRIITGIRSLRVHDESRDTGTGM